jgi:preprotein translocase subunit SecF
LISLFFLGGGVIHDFAFAMIIGVTVGTYSSIFIASPVVISMQPKKKTSK